MDKKIDIHKAAGILIKDRKILVERDFNEKYFVGPGGRLSANETAHQALIRELKEEFSIETDEKDFEEFGTFYAQAADEPGRYLQMDVFIVRKWVGEVIPSSEVEEVLWINSNPPENTKVGSIFLHDVLPKLKEKNLID